MAGLAVLVSWQILNGSQDFSHTFSMALYHKWDVKNDFAYVLQFFSLISDVLGSVLQRTYMQYIFDISDVFLPLPALKLKAKNNNTTHTELCLGLGSYCTLLYLNQYLLCNIGHMYQEMLIQWGQRFSEFAFKFSFHNNFTRSCPTFQSWMKFKRNQ